MAAINLDETPKHWWNTVVTCKYCGIPELYGRMIWKNGSEYCPACYEKLKREAQNRRK